MSLFTKKYERFVSLMKVLGCDFEYDKVKTTLDAFNWLCRYHEEAALTFI